jgi:hypothetical protein
MKDIFQRFIAFYNPERFYIKDRFYGVFPLKDEYLLPLVGYLNSTVVILFLEILGRTGLGQGALDIHISEISDLAVPVNLFKEEIRSKLVKCINVISRREIKSIFEELGANSSEEVSLDKVKPDRRELDKIIMGEVLGLTEEEQLEVYKAVIQLVKERIERAKSVEKEKKKRKKIREEAYAEKIISEIDVSKLNKFPDDYLPSQIVIEKTIQLPEEKEKVEIGRDLLGYYVKIGNEKIKCSSVEEAKWIYYSAISGKSEVKIPKDVSVLDKILRDFEQVYNSISKEINERLEKYIPEIKFRKNVKAIIERKLGIKL